MSVWLILTVSALTIYAIRVAPFLFLRKPIKNRFLRSFLYYVPYVTLSVMTFPAILTATGNLWAGLAALVVGAVTAFLSGDLFVVALSCCGTVFLMQLIF